MKRPAPGPGGVSPAVTTGSETQIEADPLFGSSAKNILKVRGKSLRNSYFKKRRINLYERQSKAKAFLEQIDH